MLLGILLVLLTAAGIGLFAAKPLWFPAAINATAIAYDRQFSTTLLVLGIIFITVQLLLAWVVLRRRSKLTRAGDVKSASIKLEVAWTAASLLLFVSLALTGNRSWAAIPESKPNQETIEVYAHQFAWNFRYPGPDKKFGKSSRDFVNDAQGNSTGIDPRDPAGLDDRTTATLRIPAGSDVLLLLHSRDVIHDFFVRELRTKQDVVPGMEIPFLIHVDRPGTYEIACAELCGLGHSQMASQLIVLSPEDYEKWKQSKWAQ